MAWLAGRRDLDHGNRAALMLSIPEFNQHGLTSDDPLAVCSQVARHLAAETKSSATNRSVLRAEARARAWLEQGVTALTATECGLPESGSYSPLLSAWGDLSLLDNKKVALLNSRKPRGISPRARWLKRTVTVAASELALSANVLVSGYGNCSYELSCFLAARHRAGLIMVCDCPLPLTGPGEVKKKFLLKYRSLFSNQGTLVISGFSPGRSPSRKEAQVMRDELVAALADTLLGVEIREKGNMFRILDLALEKGRRVAVLDTPETGRETAGNRRLLLRGARAIPVQDFPQASPQYPTPPARPRATMARNLPTQKTYLFHFTRACPGPWPGQTLDDYYRSLVEEDPAAGHSALDTLRRILAEKRIRAGCRLTRRNIPAVSLTACSLAELDHLIRWRPALIRWTMEPFGLAIDKEAAMDQGAQPVLYGDEECWRRLPPQRHFLFQLHQAGQIDWTREKEWRCPGDLVLEGLAQDQLLAVVPAEYDDEIRDFFEGRVIAV